MRTLLLIDASMLLYKALFAHPLLSYDGMHTGALYGSVQQVTSAIVRFEASAVVVCYDFPPYWRKKELPTYKEGRNFAASSAPALIGAIKSTGDLSDAEQTSSNDAIRNIVKKTATRLRAMFSCLGIPLFHWEGLEADDLIGAAVREFSSEFDRTVILSSDSDLHQLLDGFRTYTVRKGGELYGREDFEKEHGIPPDKWAFALAYSGSHNGVPGVRGVGLKTAVKALKGSVKGKARDLIDSMSAEQYALNVRLITLPHPDADPGMLIPAIELYPPMEQDFIRWLSLYGIEYSHSMMLAVQQLKQSIRRHGRLYD